MPELVLVANAADGTISVLRLHREPAPRLEPLGTSGSLPGCGTFAVDAERDLVYAAYKGGVGREPGIAVLRLDRDTATLTELSRTPVEAPLTYLTLSSDGAVLLGVSYSGGFGAGWPVTDQGLGPQRDRFEYANLHCIVLVGAHVYAVSLGEDLIAQFRLGSDGRLTPLKPPTAAAPQGSGPRHLVARSSNAYLVTEFSGEVIHYRRRADGTLDLTESLLVVDPRAGLAPSHFGADPRQERLIWGADIQYAGVCLLTTERNSSKLTSTSLLGSGHLGRVVAHLSTEQQPRGFGVSDDGAYAVCVGERSTYAQLVQVGADGTLTQLDRVPVGRGANWVRFLSQPANTWS